MSQDTKHSWFAFSEIETLHYKQNIRKIQNYQDLCVETIILSFVQSIKIGTLILQNVTKCFYLQLVEQLWTKLDRYLRVLKTNKLTVENYYQFHLRMPLMARQDCCTLTNNDLR